MGRSKATLPFGPETLLARIVRLLSQVVSLRIVVAAVDQELSDLPADVLIARDRHPGRGPLEGLRAGLEAGQAAAELFYVSSCDTPLLVPDFARAVLDLWEPSYDAVVPRDTRHHHPLAAVYHRRVLPEVARLLDQDLLRPYFLLQRVRTREVPVELLRAADPTLASLENLNRPEDYRAALQRAGYAPPTELPAAGGV